MIGDTAGDSSGIQSIQPGIDEVMHTDISLDHTQSHRLAAHHSRHLSLLLSHCLGDLYIDASSAELPPLIWV